MVVTGFEQAPALFVAEMTGLPIGQGTVEMVIHSHSRPSHQKLDALPASSQIGQPGWKVVSHGDALALVRPNSARNDEARKRVRTDATPNQGRCMGEV
jgi:hypothetical protein